MPHSEETSADPAMEPDRNRPCPVCGDAMQPEPRSGVTVDICDEHGIWFDSGELERFIFVMNAKKLPARRRRLQEARKKARRESGARGHWLNFLME